MSAEKHVPVPPSNLEAEESVLGAMMLSAVAIDSVSEIVQPRDFYRDSHATIYRACLALHSEGKPVDALTVADYLQAAGELEGIGGQARILEIATLVPSTTNAYHYAGIVRRKAIERGLTVVGEKIQRLGWEGAEDSPALLAQAEGLVFDLAQGGARTDFVPLSDAVSQTVTRLEELHAGGKDITGLPSGFDVIDRLTQGWQPGNLIIVAARPAMGKSALATAFAAHTCIRQELPVALFTLEMSRLEVVQRLLSAEALVEAQKLRNGRMDGSDWRNVMEWSNRLTRAPLFIDDNGLINATDIRSKARRLKLRHPGLALVIVDYLQLMARAVSSSERVNEVAQISRTLKILAGELEIPVIALSQLSRALETRHDRRPILSDLRDCVAGSTTVALADGRYVPIRDLVGTAPTVWALDERGKVGRHRAERVWHVGARPVYEVRLATGQSLTATLRHRLRTWSGWTTVEKLSPGDRVAIPRHLPEPRKTEPWPEEQIVLLGQLVGDGSYLVHQPLRYTTASEENSAAVVAAATALGSTVRRVAGRGNWHQLIIAGNGNRWHHRGVNAWLRELGIYNQRSAEKHLPQSVYRLPNEQVALLLRHLWATDGTICIRANGRVAIAFSTASLLLASDVARLLLRFGIVSRLKRAGSCYMVDISDADSKRAFLQGVGAFGPRIGPHQAAAVALDGHVANTNVDTLPMEAFGDVRALMRTGGVSHREMARRIGTSYGGSGRFNFAPSRRQIRRYADALESQALREQAESDVFWDTVTAIRESGVEEVYDLTVPGPASWIADGIVSHNSGALEQDADLVLFIYRDEVYNAESTDQQGIAELNLAKHRNGPTDTVRVAFVKRYAKFSPLPRPGAGDPQ